MLVLSRKRGESIIINNDIEIYISLIEGDNVKIGIRAPEHVIVLRKELVEEVEASNREAISKVLDPNLLLKIKK
ncbi:carbon storage regulator [Paenibacillus lautus]|uniref:carbon storage regulator n=1 Tax=Paenibacillus TaxID=44249 RepID=UPI00240D6897|nr:carbon storage regulator [Paenibacillus sp. BR1-192]MBY0163239.1 carbon storage regulator [Cytobacillus firmus]WFB58171.1 carbon storage regulator [Paenibacillus sp. BR1-192]